MREKIYALLAAAAVLTAVGLAGCTNNPKANDDAADETAATVNGVKIPVSKLDRIIDQQLKRQTASGLQSAPLTEVELAQARMAALDNLIQEEALFQRAQKEGVVPTDDELKQEIQAQKQRLGLTEDQFQKYLQQNGQTEDEFKSDAKRTLAIQKLRDKVTAKVPQPTDAEIQKYFEENKAQLVAPRGVDLSDIVVDPRDNKKPDGDDAKSPEEAKKKADEIGAALKGGADFATTAGKRSEDPQSAPRGGALGFFSEDQLKQSGFSPEQVARFFGMSPGQTTEPIAGSDGRLHIFKLNDKREQARELTFDEVRPQIAQRIIEQRRQLILDALLVDALSSANVKNLFAARLLDHPDNFGGLRPSPLTAPKPATPAAAPAEAQPGGEAQPSEPAKK